RLAGIPGCIGGNGWRHTSPHGQQGENGQARSCPQLYCSNVQYTSKNLTRECGGNIRDASPCSAAVAKSAFGIPSMFPPLSSPFYTFFLLSILSFKSGSTKDKSGSTKDALVLPKCILVLVVSYIAAIIKASKVRCDPGHH